MPLKNDEVSSLSHTKWDCKYHIVFTPKHRRKAIYVKLRADIGKCIRRCCLSKGVDIIEAHANLKYNYGARHFWSEGYYVSTVGLNKRMVQNYIKNQELEDQIEDRRSMKEYKNPFTGNYGWQGQLGDLKRGMIAPASNRPYRPDRKTAP